MILQCLTFVIRLCSEKNSSNICATRIRNEINKRTQWIGKLLITYFICFAWSWCRHRHRKVIRELMRNNGGGMCSTSICLSNSSQCLKPRGGMRCGYRIFSVLVHFRFRSIFRFYVKLHVTWRYRGDCTCFDILGESFTFVQLFWFA